ncbi:hypothetical protein AMECASPLE_000328 [Ameca splendens]|uniref:Uncharacterized protein n=1 Tax=Ameca splendens TaxID=208324 RepID=A0ABV0ZUH0_9TELE
MTVFGAFGAGVRDRTAPSGVTTSDGRRRLCHSGACWPFKSDKHFRLRVDAARCLSSVISRSAAAAQIIYPHRDFKRLISTKCALTVSATEEKKKCDTEPSRLALWGVIDSDILHTSWAVLPPPQLS